MLVQNEIVFGQGGGRDLHLDLFQPAQAAKALVLMVHGGGWRRGSPEGIAAYATVLARLGFAAATAEYRLLDEAPWPAQLDDVKAAVAWAVDNAPHLGVPSGRIVVLGFSAGGHLALLAADDMKGQVAAVVALFPPVELVFGAPDIGKTAASELLEGEVNEEAARLASPLHRVGPDFPPTFLLHGAADWLVPHVTSQRMFDALSAAGVKAELHIYAGHTHEFAEAPYMMEDVALEVTNFLHRLVVDPAGARIDDLKYNPFAHGPKAPR